MIRITKGVPRFNIQIGPVREALHYNPSMILSVTDFLDETIAQYPHFHWMPINESGKSWGYKPFFVAKRLLDFFCLELKVPLVYLCCSAGKHRSPMTAFCWLLSHPDATPESVVKEFYGIDDDLLKIYENDVKCGYIPPNLSEVYKLMRGGPYSYHEILHSMRKSETITYQSNKWTY